jgi:RNA polymerase sigma-70 factor (ECF subfamily)
MSLDARHCMADDLLNRLTQTVLGHAAAMALYARQWLDGADSASADDVVQEALTALLAQSPPPRDPVAWMYRAVRNAAIDHARASSRRRRRERVIAEARREWFESSGGDVSAIDARAAEEALLGLSQRDREIVVLRIWGDMSLAQIAQIVELSVSTVHGRYTAALSQMRAALEKSCSTNPMH